MSIWGNTIILFVGLWAGSLPTHTVWAQTPVCQLILCKQVQVPVLFQQQKQPIPNSVQLLVNLLYTEMAGISQSSSSDNFRMSQKEGDITGSSLRLHGLQSQKSRTIF